MFSRCGDLDQAKSAFYEAKKCNKMDIAVWNSMIAAYEEHGERVKANIFQQMKSAGCRPNSITFSSLLNVYSHSGLVEDALEVYYQLDTMHMVSPRYQTSNMFVDALGRAGRLDEAEKFIETEIKEADLAVWMLLLGACRSHKDIHRAERIASIVHSLSPSYAPAYILLANTYTATGHPDKQQELLAAMRGSAKKTSGISVVELNGVIHTFVANDTNHKDVEQVQKTVRKMYTKIKEAGSQTELVWSDYDEGERQQG